MRGRGGLALGGEGGRHGLLALVHHVALVVPGVALHHSEAEGVVVPHSNLLQVVHGGCSLDRLFVRGRLGNPQLRKVRVEASQTTGEHPCLKRAGGCLKHPMW